MFCIVKAIFGFLSFLPLLEASSCDADPGPSKNPALLQVKRHPLETVQPEVIPPLQQVHKGPLFEQCRTRASSSPHLTRRGFEAQNATVSLLSSGRSCSADPVTLVAFSSNGQATISCCDAELRQSVGSEKVSVGPVLDLIAGRAVPPVSFSSADASESPPVAFYAACTSSATTDVVFDVTTGDLLVRGHAAFRLQMLSGELTGIPDMGVLEQCQNVARCKLQLDCSFFGESALVFGWFGHLVLRFVKRSVQVVIRDDTCWQLADDKWQTLRSLPTHLGGTCRARCRADAGCAAYAETNSGGSAGTSVDCRGCAPSDFTRAHVRINDCDGASSCLMIRKTGPGAAFLEGEYCPTEDVGGA
eukprot:g20274.t1